MTFAREGRPTPEEISERLSKNPAFQKERHRTDEADEFRRRWLEAETIHCITKHYRTSIKRAQYRAERFRIKGHIMKQLTVKKADG